MTSLATIAKSYFDGLAARDLTNMPWADDAVLRTPLLPAPLTGRAALLEFFNGIMPGLADVRLEQCYLAVDGNTVVAEARVGPLHVMDKFIVRDGRVVEQQNIFDPRPVLESHAPGALSAQERVMLIELLEHSRDEFSATVRAARDHEWNRRESAGWTASECAEHIALSDEVLLGMIGNMLGSPADSSVEQQAGGKDGLVLNAMRDREHRSKTWEALEPRDRWRSRDAVLDAFLARRAATIDFVRYAKAPLHYHGSPLGALGMLDACQWLLLIAAHTGRHVAQMRQAMA